ncbi:unnamed protein product [Urochloa humidicola]
MIRAACRLQQLHSSYRLLQSVRDQKIMGRRGLLTAAGIGGAAGQINNSMWPDLVGRHLTDAMGVIESERPDVHIKLFAAADPEPRDFDPHRVCLFVDDNFTVVRMPVVG